MSKPYLPDGLPVPNQDSIALPYWQGTRAGKLVIQKCGGCGKHQWGPEWVCHRCHSFDLGWAEVAPRGRIYSWQRPYHPVHGALTDHGPYLIVLVELPGADGIRMVGNLLGDPMQEVRIGAEVEAVFEPHDTADPPYTLVQWRMLG
ncbi:OB-fold domain-containing protein [Belnapia sp. T6]|uniref:OB-fold domain-containing protein n=1 Tax=Belnapia mucosa TaxID=2804532 RepID=A0ABS1V6P7_9PROT|nr:OB-fold domain-containing protein [Belnapia mucosa]MBL6457346.1 OB-fold domain-containing protein [Belnapia mucosa]